MQMYISIHEYVHPSGQEHIGDAEGRHSIPWKIEKRLKHYPLLLKLHRFVFEKVYIREDAYPFGSLIGGINI